eukprot:UN06040
MNMSGLTSPKFPLFAAPICQGASCSPSWRTLLSLLLLLSTFIRTTKCIIQSSTILHSGNIAVSSSSLP